jgi:hypothetical protein
MMEVMESPVRLQLAAHQRYIRVARAVASSLAAARGFDVEEIDDLRIAVDELCNALLALGDATSITLELTDDATGDGSVLITGSSPAREDGSGAAAWSDPSFDLARQILDVVATEYEIGARGDDVVFWLRQARRPQG